jgi:hypothetical protein
MPRPGKKKKTIAQGNVSDVFSENIAIVTLCEDNKEISFNGTTYPVKPDLAYFTFELCHSLPSVNSKGRALTIKTMQKAFETAAHQLVNYRHLIADNFADLDHDRITGFIVDVSFPVEEFAEKGLLTEDMVLAEGATTGIPIIGLGCLFKRAQGVTDLLDQHLSGEANWMVSMECERPAHTDMILWDGQTFPRLQAPKELAECIEPHSMKDYKGKPTVLIVAGDTGEACFNGMGLTMRPADQDAEILQMVASLIDDRPVSDGMAGLLHRIEKKDEAAGNPEFMLAEEEGGVMSMKDKIIELMDALKKSMNSLEETDGFKSLKKAAGAVSEARSALFAVQDQIWGMVDELSEKKAVEVLAEKIKAGELISKEEAEKMVAEKEETLQAETAEKGRCDQVHADRLVAMKEAGLAEVPETLVNAIAEIPATDEGDAEFKVLAERLKGRNDLCVAAKVEVTPAIAEMIALGLASEDTVFEKMLATWMPPKKLTDKEIAERSRDNKPFVPAVGGGGAEDQKGTRRKRAM